MSIPNRAILLIGAATLGGLVSLPGVPVSAQGRAVVQPLPPAASTDLNNALLRLASNPRDTDALIRAGNASLELGDIDAAIGFFGRAEELSPNNPRVKAGTAAAYVRARRPVEALRLFDEAERAGVRPDSVAGDKGLALDLVGNNREAQLAYRRSLANDEDSEIRRRMALSFAIAGDSEGFESTLLPLLNQRDLGAYRTRAFGLAILGKPDEAVAITEAVMPKDMAERVEPYLRYMRRLTPAQQAAASNLGIFPRASAIGRDDPRIAEARTAGSSPAIAGLDSGLAPAGRALGQASQNAAAPAAQAANGPLTRAERQALRAQRRDNRRAGSASPTPASAPTSPPVPALATRTSETSAETPVRRTGRGELPALAAADVPNTTAPVAALQLPASSGPAPSQAATPAPAPVQIARTEPALVITLPSASAGLPAQQAPQPVTQVAVAASQAVPDTAPVSGSPSSEAVTVASIASTVSEAVGGTGQAAAPAPGFDLDDLAAGSTASAQTGTSAASTTAPSTAGADPVAVAAVSSGPVETSPSAPDPSPAPVAERSVSQAFADLQALPDTGALKTAGDAVDITAIDIPREEEAAPEPEAESQEPPAPETPAHASRIWVQVATGRDRSALGFDWRRFSRQAPDVLKDNGPFVASWGQTNRLLAGPYDSRSDANAAVTALAEKDLDAFRFTSSAGEVIEELGK